MSANSDKKWILVEWGNTKFGVVQSSQIVYAEDKNLAIGCTAVIKRGNDQEIATYLGSANNKKEFAHMVDTEETEEPDQENQEEPVQDVVPEEEPRDYSSSASSWTPSDDDVSESSDSETEDGKKKKNKNNNNVSKQENANKDESMKKVLTPSNKVNAIVPNSMKKKFEKSANNKIQKRKVVKNKAKKIVEINAKIDREPKLVNVCMNQKIIAGIKFMFDDLLFYVRSLKSINGSDSNDDANNGTLEDELRQQILPVPDEPEVPETQDQEMYNNSNEELNRSTDHVLITNKFDHIENISQNKENEDVYDIQNEQENDECIAIGSGKTIIEKEKFRKIKWTSYTMATRGLLLAVFPRRVLATHSLTGKRSPAFQHKPAKMCLDPKKVSDIIIEVMNRFDVKENLIRSIITTKCADECKMFRMRMEKKGLTPKKNANDSNLSMDQDASIDM